MGWLVSSQTHKMQPRLFPYQLLFSPFHRYKLIISIYHDGGHDNTDERNNGKSSHHKDKGSRNNSHCNMGDHSTHSRRILHSSSTPPLPEASAQLASSWYSYHHSLSFSLVGRRHGTIQEPAPQRRPCWVTLTLIHDPGGRHVPLRKIFRVQDRHLKSFRNTLGPFQKSLFCPSRVG